MNESSKARFLQENIFSTSFYLYMARTLGCNQPVPVRFFYVIGADRAPWIMIELDIDTGEPVEEHELKDGSDWKELWSRIGLAKMRTDLTEWLSTSPVSGGLAR